LGAAFIAVPSPCIRLGRGRAPGGSSQDKTKTPRQKLAGRSWFVVFVGVGCMVVLLAAAGLGVVITDIV